MGKKLYIAFAYTSFIVASIYFLSVFNIYNIWAYLSIATFVGVISRKNLGVWEAFFAVFIGVLIGYASQAKLLEASTWVEAAVSSSSMLLTALNKKFWPIIVPIPFAIFSFFYFSSISGIVSYMVTTAAIYLILKRREG